MIQVRGQALIDALERLEDPAPPATVGRTLSCVWALAGAALLLASAAPAATPAPGFDFEAVRSIARELAQQPYRSPENAVPKVLLDLDYDAHRDIRFKPARSIWRAEGLPFQLQFFHLGLYFNRPVAINLVERGVARRFPFDPSLFDYGRNRFSEPLPADLGYAGFRAHARINRKDYFDEVIVFVGASYFRAVAKDLRYGLSARGVAIDTASTAPRSSRTSRNSGSSSLLRSAKQLVIYALLDGPSLAGAYRFAVEPGKDTVPPCRPAFLRARARSGSAWRRSPACSGTRRTARPISATSGPACTTRTAC